jgi:hypothetical protein
LQNSYWYAVWFILVGPDGQLALAVSRWVLFLGEFFQLLLRPISCAFEFIDVFQNWDITSSAMGVCLHTLGMDNYVINVQFFDTPHWWTPQVLCGLMALGRSPNLSLIHRHAHLLKHECMLRKNASWMWFRMCLIG